MTTASSEILISLARRSCLLFGHGFDDHLCLPIAGVSRPELRLVVLDVDFAMDSPLSSRGK